MTIAHLFQEKWLNRTRQFGAQAAFRQIVLALVRPVWQIKRNLVMAIPEHQPGGKPNQPVISTMTYNTVETAAEHGELDERQRTRLLSFLINGCTGFFCMVENQFAGYAFIQPTGIYTFAGNGGLQIPVGMVMLKNLYVFPQFRGHSLGKKLNQARIASIPVNQTPIVFVIPENRFAIRNLKMFGFEEMLIITRITWFKKWTTQRFRKISNCHLTQRLIDGLESNSNTIQK